MSSNEPARDELLEQIDDVFCDVFHRHQQMRSPHTEFRRRIAALPYFSQPAPESAAGEGVDWRDVWRKMREAVQHCYDTADDDCSARECASLLRHQMNLLVTPAASPPAGEGVSRPPMLRAKTPGWDEEPRWFTRHFQANVWVDTRNATVRFVCDLYDVDRTHSDPEALALYDAEREEGAGR